MIDWSLIGFCAACALILASAGASAFDIVRLRRVNRSKP